MRVEQVALLRTKPIHIGNSLVVYGCSTRAIQMEMSEKFTSLATEHDAKTRELEAELQSARDQITTMQKEQQEVAERHSKELEEAKRLGAEEEQQKFANMSWLERIQKKS